MRKLLLVLASLLLLASPAWAGNLVLTWMDNSTNEALFHVERRGEACGTGTSLFAEIATVGANVITYTDVGAGDGITKCYRVRASNSAGFSAYSNEAMLTLPAAPTGLVVQ